MDVLLDEAKRKGLQLNGQLDPTAADVAVQVYLRDKALLERKHAERYLTRPRSFEHFQTDVQPLPAYEPLPPQTRAALECALDDWFVQKKRGRGSRVFEFLREDEVWFLVRHGDPFRREGSFDAGGSILDPRDAILKVVRKPRFRCPTVHLTEDAAPEPLP